MGYTPKFLIDNVSVKLPYRAFAILKKSWEMIVTPDNDCIMLQPAVPKLFRAWLKSESMNILQPKSQTACVNMKKMLIVWMIFGSTFRTVARKSSIGGFYVRAGGGLTFNFDKNPLICSVSYFNLGRLSPPNHPVATGLSRLLSLFSVSAV